MPPKTQFMAYITKYALTAGIEYRLVEFGCDTRYTYTAGVRSLSRIQYGPKDWHATYWDAQARAEEMRANKVASLQNQIARINAIEFSEPAKETTDA